MPYCDLHTHTVFSPDSTLTTAKLCADAHAAGLFGLAITDHYDFFVSRRWYYESFVPERQVAFEKAKSLWGGNMKIWKGIELGQPHVNMELYKKVMAREDFDVVIGSIHDMPDGTPIYHQDYDSQQGCDDLLERYFSEMTKMIESCDIDILGHLDYPVRVMEPWFKREVSLIYYKDLIHPILKLCAQRDIAIEINTAGPRKWLPDPGPAPWVLKDYKDLGGKYVTMGSDAHRPSHCGWLFDRAAEVIIKGGFDHIAYYEGRKPRLLSL